MSEATEASATASDATEATEASVTSDALARALQHLEANHHADALKMLLVAWRATRSVLIATTIDVISKELTRHEPPIVGVGKTPERQVWQEAVDASAERPAAYVRLLEAVPFNSNAPTRINTIFNLAADPRITESAREWLTTKPPLTNENRVPFYATLFEILDRNEDTRIVPLLLDLTTRDRRKPTTRRVGLKNWKPLVELTSRLGRVQAAATVKGDVLSTDERVILGRIDSMLATARPATVIGLGGDASSTNPKDLFARVYANPDDDEARAVLGDLLQQANDPRGELIALQLARHGTNKPKTPRERELEAQWGRTWLGPIGAFLDKKDGAIFERGFPARCTLAYNTPRLLAYEEWATVTHLNLGSTNGTTELGELLASPIMRALRHVTGLQGDALRRCFAGGPAREREPNTPWKWTTLGVRGWRREDVALLLDGPQGIFPEVRKLISEVYSGDVMAEDVLRIIDRWPAISELTSGVNQEDLPTVIVSPIPKRLDRLLLKTNSNTGGNFEVELIPKTKPRKMHVIVQSFWGDVAASLNQMVTAVLEPRGRRAASARADAIDHVHITTGNARAKVVDDVITHGRWEKLDISELRSTAKRNAVTLTVLKEKPTAR